MNMQKSFLFISDTQKQRNKILPALTYKNGLCKTHKPKLLLKIDRTLEK